MTVECAKCGEPLMGAVNRCWKCGQEFPGVADTGRPPVRVAVSEPPDEGSPPADSSTADASTADANTADANTADEATEASAAADPPPPEQPAGEAARIVATPVAEAARPQRQRTAPARSPFAEEARAGTIHSPAPRTVYPRNIANVAGAVSSLVLGVAAIVEAFYVPVAAVVTAAVGILCGLWGMRSRRRTIAIIGVSLCCLALAIGSFRAAVEVYEHNYGHSPFAPNEVVPEGEEEFDEYGLPIR